MEFGKNKTDFHRALDMAQQQVQHLLKRLRKTHRECKKYMYNAIAKGYAEVTHWK